MSKETENKSMLEKFASFGKLIGVAFIGLGAILSNPGMIGLGVLKVVGGKVGEDYFKKKK